MSKIKVKVGDIQAALSFLAPGFEKTGTYADSQLLHFELLKNSKNFLVLTTRNRYVIARYAIVIPKVDIESFERIVQYERFRNVVHTFDPEAELIIDVSSEDKLTVINSGRYNFTLYDTLYSTELPKVHVNGTVDYNLLHKLLLLAKPFTSIDKKTSTLSSAKAIRLVYDEENKLLKSMVIGSSVAAQFSTEVPTLKAFDVYLKGSVIAKMQPITTEEKTTVLVNDDFSSFGVGIGKTAKMVIATLNDIEESASVVDEIMAKSRPYYFKLDPDKLDVLLKRMINFTEDDLLVSVSDGKAVVTAEAHGKIEAQEELECEHSGTMNLRLPIRILNNILKTTGSIGKELEFKVDESASTALVTQELGNKSKIEMKVVFSTEGEES